MSPQNFNHGFPSAAKRQPKDARTGTPHLNRNMNSLFSRKKRKKTKRRGRSSCLISFAFFRSFRLIPPFFVTFVSFCSNQTKRTQLIAERLRSFSTEGNEGNEGLTRGMFYLDRAVQLGIQPSVSEKSSQKNKEFFLQCYEIMGMRRRYR